MDVDPPSDMRKFGMRDSTVQESPLHHPEQDLLVDAPHWPAFDANLAASPDDYNSFHAEDRHVPSRTASRLRLQ
jgi:hypothetical protein